MSRFSFLEDMSAFPPWLVVCLVAVTSVAQDQGRIEVARGLLREGRPQEAVAYYLQVLEQTPRDASLWSELARARLAARQTREALRDFERAVRLEPNFAEAQAGLAAAAEEAGDLERALIEWRRLTHIGSDSQVVHAKSRIEDLLFRLGVTTGPPRAPVTPAPAAVPARPRPPAPPHDPDTVYQKALRSFEQRQWDSAIEGFRDVLRRRPGHTGSYYHAGVVRLEQGRTDMAAYNLQRAVRDPVWAHSAHWQLGRLAERLKRPADARHRFQKALETNPQGLFADSARARLGMAEPARVTPPAPTPPPSGRRVRPPSTPSGPVRTILSWTPPDLPLPSSELGTPQGGLLAAAEAQRTAKMFEASLETLEDLRLSHPRTESGRLAGLSKALVHAAAGDWERAAQHAREHLQTSPGDQHGPTARFIEALAHLARRQPAEAVTTLSGMPQRESGVLPFETDRLAALGHALMLAGRPAEAAPVLRRASQSSPDTAQRRIFALRAARAWQLAGTAGEALPLLAEVTEPCDDSEVCRLLRMARADLSWSQGRHNDALRFYRAALGDNPQGDEAAWALYQIGNAHRIAGRADSAIAVWQQLDERHSDSWWNGQARLRLEDVLWQKRRRTPR